MICVVPSLICSQFEFRYHIGKRSSLSISKSKSIKFGLFGSPYFAFKAVEGIWNRFRNPILVWEFLKSLNFGRLETVEFRPETLEFRSDISNLGTFLEHFWQSWNFGPFGVSSSSQQRIWYKFESYPYEKTTPDAGDGWARISLFKF